MQLQFVLEGVVRPHHEPTPNHFHEVELIHRLLDLMVFENLGLGGDFHREKLERLVLALRLDTPYLAFTR